MYTGYKLIDLQSEFSSITPIKQLLCCPKQSTERQGEGKGRRRGEEGKGEGVMGNGEGGRGKAQVFLLCAHPSFLAEKEVLSPDNNRTESSQQ